MKSWNEYIDWRIALRLRSYLRPPWRKMLAATVLILGLPGLTLAALLLADWSAVVRAPICRGE